MHIKASQYIYLALKLVLSIALISCSQNNGDVIKSVLEASGDNRDELEGFLNHYHDNSQQRQAAEYTVVSMPGRIGRSGPGLDSLNSLFRLAPEFENKQFTGSFLDRAKNYASMPVSSLKDIDIISADYLIENLDEAWETYKQRQWNEKLTLEQFCEYILPYRIGDEPLSAWRKPYRDLLSSLKDTLAKQSNSVAAARLVSEFLGPIHYNSQVSHPHLSALQLLSVPVGSCREDCDRNLYAMRSMGIPVATDIILVSPDIFSSHQWNVVYDNDDRIFRLFDNKDFLPTRDSLHNDRRSKGKVYRQTFGLNLDRLERYNKVKNLPASLMNPRLKDVTEEYFGTNEAIVHIDAGGDIFLGLFGKGSYHPVDIAEKKYGKAIFRNIEPNVIFFPISGDESKYQPCGYPFLLKKDGEVHIFKPNPKKEKVILERKYPRGIHTDNRLATAIGLRIDWRDSKKGVWENISVISRKPDISYHRIPLKGGIRKGFLRISKTNGPAAQIAEIILSHDDKAKDILPLEIAYEENTKECKTGRYGQDFQGLIDGDVLTWKCIPDGENGIVFEFDSDRELTDLFIVVHNDDNFVLPGQEYELLYFENPGWRSLGRKVANDFHIEFEAPENAVLLLKNHTKGNEEQIFIYRNNRQMFNQDLVEAGL